MPSPQLASNPPVASPSALPVNETSESPLPPGELCLLNETQSGHQNSGAVVFLTPPPE